MQTAMWYKWRGWWIVGKPAVPMQVRHKLEAEATASSLPPPVNKTEAQELKVRF
jgi:hypothetical protein